MNNNTMKRKSHLISEKAATRLTEIVSDGRNLLKRFDEFCYNEKYCSYDIKSMLDQIAKRGTAEINEILNNGSHGGYSDPLDEVQKSINIGDCFNTFHDTLQAVFACGLTYGKAMYEEPMYENMVAEGVVEDRDLGVFTPEEVENLKTQLNDIMHRMPPGTSLEFRFEEKDDQEEEHPGNGG